MCSRAVTGTTNWLWHYHSQLKPRTQPSGKFVQEFSTIVQQLFYWALVSLPQYYIQKEAAYAFVNEVKDQEMQQHFLSGSKRKLNEALS
jgi:hypothetical protein